MGGTHSHGIGGAVCFDCSEKRTIQEEQSRPPVSLGLANIPPGPLVSSAVRVEKTHARALARAIDQQKLDKSRCDETIKQMAEVENRLRIVAPKLKALEHVKHHSGSEYHRLEKEHTKLLAKKGRLKQLFNEQSTQASNDRVEVAALAALVSAEREQGCAVHRTATAVRSGTSPEPGARSSTSPAPRARRSTSPMSARRAGCPEIAPAGRGSCSPERGRTMKLVSGRDQHQMPLVAPEAA